MQYVEFILFETKFVDLDYAKRSNTYFHMSLVTIHCTCNSGVLTLNVTDAWWCEAGGKPSEAWHSQAYWCL